MISDELAKSEILDWWSLERGNVYAECEETRQKLIAKISSQIDELSFREMSLPGSKKRREILREAQSDLTMLSKRIARRLDSSVKASILLTEGSGLSAEDRAPLATMAAGGAAALGAVGLAATAASLATSTVTYVSIVSITTINWPAALLVGGTALSLAAVSPAAVARGRRMLSERFKKKAGEIVTKGLMPVANGGDKNSICSIHFNYLDEIKDKRLENIQWL